MAESSNWYAADVATFGDRLIGARDAAGLTQEELAQRLGVRRVLRPGRPVFRDGRNDFASSRGRPTKHNSLEEWP